MKWRLLLILMSLCGIAFSALAGTHTENCFRNHLKDASTLNKSRKEAYSQLTNGESDKIFKRLILLEQSIRLFIAGVYDRKAKAFQDKGIDLLCQEFRDMSHAPEFNSPKLTFKDTTYERWNWEPFKLNIKNAVKMNDVESIRLQTLRALKDLFEYPGRHCMKRHLLESLYRFAYFYPRRVKEAELQQLAGASDLMINIMNLHLSGLKDADNLDELARPLQDKGISVICSEMPDLIEDLDAPELIPLRTISSESTL